MNHYFDNSERTKPLASSLEQMQKIYKERWGTLGSLHDKGQELIPVAQNCFENIYELMGAQESDRFFLFSSSEEALSEILFASFIDVIRESGRNHFLCLNSSQASNLPTFKKLEKLGCVLKTLGTNAQGQLEPAVLEEAIRPRTALVSLPWADGLTGVIHPLHDLAAICAKKEVVLHVDASHVIGKLFFRFQDLGADLLSFEGDVFHAPEGSCGLFMRQASPLISLGTSKGDQNVATLSAFSYAVEIASLHFDHLCTETARLRDKFERGIQEGFSDAKVFFQEVERLPHISVIAFPGIESETLLFALNREKLYATTGGGRFPKLPSHLKQCGIDAKLAHSALSFALSFETKEEEVDEAIEIIVATAKRLCLMQAGRL